jgi:hypothetical protein
MSGYKRPRPNLIDPYFQEKIMRVLNPPEKNYWGPTQNFFSTLYYDYIRPHGWLLFFIFIIILILTYRYQVIQTERLLNMSIRGNNDKPQPILLNKEEINDVMDAYYHSKELSMEPIRPPTGSAYPLYPYNGGGTLIPSIRK